MSVASAWPSYFESVVRNVLDQIENTYIIRKGTGKQMDILCEC